jgi:hypothetical protein
LMLSNNIQWNPKYFKRCLRGRFDKNLHQPVNKGNSTAIPWAIISLKLTTLTKINLVTTGSWLARRKSVLSRPWKFPDHFSQQRRWTTSQLLTVSDTYPPTSAPLSDSNTSGTRGSDLNRILSVLRGQWLKVSDRSHTWIWLNSLGHSKR